MEAGRLDTARQCYAKSNPKPTRSQRRQVRHVHYTGTVMFELYACGVHAAEAASY